MMNYFRDWPRQYGIDENKKMANDTASDYDVSRKTETRLQDKQHETAKLFTSSGESP